MLTLTTYKQADFLALHQDDDDLRAPKGNFTVKYMRNRFLSCYIHGEAENLAEYDIPVFIDGEMDPDLEEQKCILQLEEDKHNCILIQWKTSGQHESKTGEKLPRWRGLICAENDDQSLEYARDCVKRKLCYL